MDYFPDQHARALRGDQPVLLRDLSGEWQVTEGAVDIFAVRLLAERVTGRREFLLRLQPLRERAQLAEVHTVIVTVPLVHLAYLRVLELGQLGQRRLGQRRLGHLSLLYLVMTRA